MTVRLCLAGILLVAGLASPAARAQFDEDADLIPGLVARYTAGKQSIERIDTSLSHDWGMSAPDPRLPRGHFDAEWTSGLLLREEGTYTFHAYLQGKISVEIDGEVVLEADRPAPGWVSGEPIELDFGLLDLAVRFERTLLHGAISPPARMQLFWSSETFPLEPIPPHLIFREEGRPDLAEIETGRQLFAAHRCNRCHVRDSDPPAPPAPGLFHVTSGLNRNWLKAKLLNQNADAAHAKMPTFGFSDEEAEAVGAWIEYIAQPADLQKTPEPKRARGDDAPTIEQEGQKLLHSVGCLACHQVGQLGHSGPFGGGDLSHIGAKRSIDWINTWLSRPERLNVQHRMPVFKLTSNERALLATTLSKLGREEADFDEIEPAGKQETEQVKRGRELAKAARCAACHKIPAMEADLAGVPTLADLASPRRQPGDASKPGESSTRDRAKPQADAWGSPDWDNSCITSADRASHRPHYPRIDAEAIKAYVNSRTGELSPPTQFARGQHVLEERNCLGCHERDLNKGIVPVAGAVAAQIDSLRGESESLIPPALTAIGDKLYDEPLAAAVSGLQKEVRLPWLHVRMPRFDHTDAEKQWLLAYLIGHDRIPEGAPTSWASPRRQSGDASGVRVRSEADSAHAPTQQITERHGADAPRSPADPQTLVIGRSLAGSGGFNCVACHKFGDYEPRNVALGTKGSDLKQIDQRMREAYFHRWTRDPLRVVPGMEMPSIKRPVDGVLDGDLDKQLAAVWAAINDPNFTAPPNPAQVEQHIVLQPGDEPRIIRDVFTVSEANGGGYVPRGIAIGFDNGHSLLFDVDTFSVRGWTFGDFAQQRTEGKSWYWDLAGVEPVGGFGLRPDIGLLPTSSDADDPAALIRPTSTRLVGYEVDGAGVRIMAELIFTLEQGEAVVPIVQSLESWSDEAVKATGIARHIALGGLPDGYRPQLSVDRLQGPSAQIIAGEAVAGDNSVAVREGDPAWTYHVVYVSRLDYPALAPKPRPELPGNEALVTTLPGFVGQRLKLPSSIMPTAIGFMSTQASPRRESGDASSADRSNPQANAWGSPLVFTSLKGHVYFATDSDGDGIEDTLTEFEEGLAAPFGILADGDSLLVAHKPELLRLTDTDGDGRADVREVVADGWGYTDNYHDWTTGPVRDSAGLLYLALGSDYQQPQRPAERSLWRGKVLKVDLTKPRGERITPFAHALRFPQGIAMDDQDRVFVTDQQGVANTFNEINHVVEGRYYGVEAMHEEVRNAPQEAPAIQVPHPWTRSVNGLMFIPQDIDGPLAPYAGHALGAEYNSKFLIRASLQEVDGQLQGATYYFTRPTWEDEANTFLGPMTVALGPDGDLYVGSIHDSGWLGGQNTGEIVRLSPGGAPAPNGIRELRATADGFEIEFLQPVDTAKAKEPASYSLSGYTRVWEGSYATPDSGRYSPRIESIDVSDDGRTVTLSVDKLRESYVYELNCTGLDDALFPATGHYTMNRIPK
jgi:mono/diheme cytochrome c family protein/glucose/arabinose dehydrogenase